MLVHAPRAIGLNADGMAGTLHSAYFLERVALWSVAPRNPRRLVCDASGAARIGRTVGACCRQDRCFTLKAPASKQPLTRPRLRLSSRLSPIDFRTALPRRTNTL